MKKSERDQYLNEMREYAMIDMADKAGMIPVEDK